MTCRHQSLKCADCGAAVPAEWPEAPSQRLALALELGATQRRLIAAELRLQAAVITADHVDGCVCGRCDAARVLRSRADELDPPAVRAAVDGAKLAAALRGAINRSRLEPGECTAGVPDSEESVHSVDKSPGRKP